MTWKRLTLIGAALLLVLAATPVVAQDNADNADVNNAEYLEDDYFFAQRGPNADGSGPGWGRFAGSREEIPEELRLTDEQREQMRNLRTQHQKEMIPLRADLKVLRVELRELMATGANESALNSKIDQIGKLRTEIQKKRMAHHLAMRNVLTEEQRDAFTETGFMGMMGERGWRGKGRFGCDGSGRGGWSDRNGRGDCDGHGPKGPRGKRGW